MTKQFGKLKLHFSKRGIAYKWGEGEIRRFSFARSGDGAPGQAYPAGGDHPQPPYGDDDGVYYSAQSYDPRYDGYDAERDGQYMGQDAPRSGSYEFLYHTDWVMWALLVLLPPLGIWILWKRERFDPVIRAAVSAASAIWFILLLIWLFSAMFGGGSDPTTSGTITPGNVVPQLTPASTIDGGAGTLPVATPDAGAGLDVTTPAATPVPAGTTGGGSDGGTTTPSSASDSATEVWATAAGDYYHHDENCSQLNGATPSKVTLAVARQRGQTACPTCVSGSGTDSGSSSSSSSAKYWATKPGTYYHVVKNCRGMKNASAVTKDKAVKDGKKPCPTCIGSYYMTASGKWYHKNKTCQNMKGAKLVTKAAAQKAKKTACPVCIGKSKTTVRYYASAGGTYYHTKATCSGMKNAVRVTLAQASQRKLKPCPTCVSTKTTSSTTYYSTVLGKYYHSKSNCSGMKGATKVTLTTAKKRGQKPCPTCIKTASTSSNTAAYYATDQGKYYHKTSTCSGMKGAKKITLATAKKKGKTACPVCLASAQTKNTYVYSTTAGKYYHSKSSCSGMKGAKKTTLSAAKKAGKKACPTCMKVTYYYTTAANRYYHQKSDCTGMKNATKLTLVSAKAKGKLACPVCVLKKASASDMNVSTYITTGGRYYHKNKTCNGMKNAKKVTLAYAKGAGRTACPRCVQKTSSTTQSADSKVKCYLTKSGTYYHATKSCAKIKGKKNIVSTSVATAKKNDKKACPDCVNKNMKTYVYVLPAGLLYHRTATCSGMKNPTKLALSTALNRAYKRCTKCNAPAAK